ncbi:MAG: ATP-binding protein [Thermoplasmata archaeon]|nr:ATP-binding protein [Thermoplasmata archaeon]
MVNELRERLKEWEEFEFPEMIEREIKVIPKEDIVAIVGPRRVGKTYLMYITIKKLLKKVPRENILYVSFDDIFYRKYNPKEILKEFESIFSPNKKYPIYIFFDEIQELNEWGRWLRSLHDSRKYKIVVSGSSSSLLLKEISTELRGRYHSILLLPFSFREYVKLKKQQNYEDMVEEYIKFGGFPEVIKLDNKVEKKQKLIELFETIFYRDFVGRHRIREEVVARNLMEFLFSNVGNRFSITKIHNTFRSLGINVSKRTLWKYTNKLEETLTLFLLRPFALSKRKEMMLPRKVYSVDTGISSIIQREMPMGRLMENVVFEELLRKNDNAELFYYIDTKNEVDFVIKRGIEIDKLIQVCYDITDFSTKEREVNSLVNVSYKLKCKKLEVITKDYGGEEIVKKRKIKFVPLWKWLLS